MRFIKDIFRPTKKDAPASSTSGEVKPGTHRVIRIEHRLSEPGDGYQGYLKVEVLQDDKPGAIVTDRLRVKRSSNDHSTIEVPPKGRPTLHIPTGSTLHAKRTRIENPSRRAGGTIIDPAETDEVSIYVGGGLKEERRRTR